MPAKPIAPIRMIYKLVVADFDGTLTKENSTWWKLHKYFGTYEDSISNLDAYTFGQIDYREFMKRDIGLWLSKRGKIHIDEISKVLLDYQLQPDAEMFLDAARMRGYDIAIISAGIDIPVKDFAKRFSIRYAMANGLEVDENGYLTGNGKFKVDLAEKDLALQQLLKETKVQSNEVIAVADSLFDESLFKSVGLSIFLGNPEKDMIAVDYKATTLQEALRWM